MNKKTSLYIVPTPIGNLGDITLRAVEVLKQADVILAEDTRTSGILLKHLQIKKPLLSYHAFNEHRTLGALIERLEKGEVMALISDAGTPGISDPGFLLTKACREKNIGAECLPGATALIPALVQSGFPTDRFLFEGFLPHKKGRQTRLKAIAEEECTVVLYESPHRLLKLLQEIISLVGEERLVSVSRELTKRHEETFTAAAVEVLEHFQQKEIKGEIVVVIAGK